MKKLNTSGCFFSKSDNNNGNKNKIANVIFMNVIIMKKLKTSVLPEEYL